MRSIATLVVAVISVIAVVFGAMGGVAALAQSEGAHLEFKSSTLKVVSTQPFTIEGGIVFENQGGAALTIRGMVGGAATNVRLVKTSTFLWLFETTREVSTVRVNANSQRELTADLGYRLIMTGFPEDYRNPGITTLYVDLGPDSDPKWDERGQLLILRYDKTLPDDGS